jgi:hypothetical protein
MSLSVLLRVGSVAVAAAFMAPEGVLAHESAPSVPSVYSAKEAAFDPFTGKISRNKVRLRLLPSLDALILTELDRDTLLNVVDESEEFYAVMPLKDTKAYVYRTYVLDGVVEGSRVNVRLEPALESPVIAQLNSGDRVEGDISALNSKWLEIQPPASTRFYVCKEYVEKVGGPSMIQDLERRSQELDQKLKTAYIHSKKELKKSFPSIDWAGIAAKFKEIAEDYSDFPSQVARGEELLTEMMQAYLQKKVSYLEAQVSTLNYTPFPKDSYDREKDPQRNELYSTAFTEELSDASDISDNKEELEWNFLFDPASMTTKMAAWVPQELALYNSWLEGNPDLTAYQFYQQQAVEQVRLHGLVEPYARVVRNKPGDYLLVHSTSNLPIAYLYSTKINLQEKVGQEVTLYGVKRANNNFAFPAYYIIAIE